MRDASRELAVEVGSEMTSLRMPDSGHLWEEQELRMS